MRGRPKRALTMRTTSLRESPRRESLGDRGGDLVEIDGDFLGVVNGLPGEQHRHLTERLRSPGSTSGARPRCRCESPRESWSALARRPPDGRLRRAPPGRRAVQSSREGASKKTTVHGSPAARSSKRRRAAPFRGTNPMKRYRSPTIPDAERAAATADGPGIGITRMPSARAAATRSVPGSLIAGVPASVTSATSRPPARISSSESARFGVEWA